MTLVAFEILKTILDLPPNLTHLTFGKKFNQIVNLPSNIINLTYNGYFNQQINIPSSIKYLKLSSDNQYIVDNLPNGIEELEFSFIEKLELNNLPTDIKKIRFIDYFDDFDDCSHYNSELNCLPQSIEYIRLNKCYDKKILNIPSKLKILECSKNYKFINDFINKYKVIKY